MKKYRKRLILAVALLGLIGLAGILGINFYVVKMGDRYIVSAENAPEADAILVLGAYVYPDGQVSTMLKDRLNTGYELYEAGKSRRILVSGDHGSKDYDEVNTMKQFLVNEGVKPDVVFMDHAGFSTYDSMYRARDIFQVKKVLIVTQSYHLKRAVFIARALGLDAYGVAADKQNYGAVMAEYQLREIAARDKDFFNAEILKPKPKFLGEAIPVSGSGALTDDKPY